MHARLRVRPSLTGARPLSSLSLLLPGGVDLSAQVPSAHARSLSLFRGPRLSALKPVFSPALSLCSMGPACQNRPPRTACALHRGRAHDRVFIGHAPTLPSLFWSPPTLNRPPPLSCAPSRAPSLSLSRSTRAPRKLCHHLLWSRARSAVAVESSPSQLSQ